MSDTFSFSVNISLPEILPPEVSSILDYMLNGFGDTPVQAPNHQYFIYSGTKFSLENLVPNGRPWLASSFSNAEGFGKFAQISMVGLKGMDSYYKVLLFLDWIAGHSAVDQIAGVATNISSPGNGDLLIFRNRLLYVTPNLGYSAQSELVNSYRR